MPGHVATRLNLLTRLAEETNSDSETTLSFEMTTAAALWNYSNSSLLELFPVDNCEYMAMMYLLAGVSFESDESSTSDGSTDILMAEENFKMTCEETHDPFSITTYCPVTSSDSNSSSSMSYEDSFDNIDIPFLRYYRINIYLPFYTRQGVFTISIAPDPLGTYDPTDTSESITYSTSN